MESQNLIEAIENLLAVLTERVSLLESRNRSLVRKLKQYGYTESSSESETEWESDSTFSDTSKSLYYNP